MEVVDQIYKLRQNFILIGLTGRTGSGCTTVANVLKTQDVNKLFGEHRHKHEGIIDNNTRKASIVHSYITQNWYPFTVIKASDVIFFYALQLELDEFISAITNPENLPLEDSKLNKGVAIFEEIGQRISKLEEYYKSLHERAVKCNKYLIEGNYDASKDEASDYTRLILSDIGVFRNELNNVLKGTPKEMLFNELQTWGNNIRTYDSILKAETPVEHAPSCLAKKINQFIKLFRAIDRYKDKVNEDGQIHPTHIVIDALRNPYEILYFRERYSAFYLMSVNTEDAIRRKNLSEKNYRLEEIKKIDETEKEKKNFTKSYQLIDIDKCIELSDIFLTHDGTKIGENRRLINQLLTYISLILHPGLVPPSPLERVMQVAYTAKLNSGCLSRQVGAAVTNESYSVQSIGWNTSAEGQTPCSLRDLFDLEKKEDGNAFSNYEKGENKFSEYACKLCGCYHKVDNLEGRMRGLTMSYCFKDIYTTASGQIKNQVHTRSLHAEENAFLQLAKYGTIGIKGGKLFTTASCCELCAKKAYQLGIKEIYYIDSYPGISREHILECGPFESRPKMILFNGVIGRAYINLYNPFIPLKDEIEALTEVEVKKINMAKEQPVAPIKKED